MIFTRHVSRNGRVNGIDSITNGQGGIMTKYVAGAGVGATSSFARRAKLYRAVATHNVPPPPVKIGPIALNVIAPYLRNYMPEFRPPNFWAYTMDGSNIYIEDGGVDMFDTGMFITPWLLSGERYDITSTDQDNYPNVIRYDTVIETTTDSNLKYISLGYIPEELTEDQQIEQIDQSLHPLTVLCYRESGPVGWQNGGNVGADGDGRAVDGYVYENANINGFNVYAGYRQVYDQNDPVICQLVILLGHPTWGSVFGPIVLEANSNDSRYCQFLMYSGAGSKNILAICTLLSKHPLYNDDPIPNSELETVIFNFTKRIKEASNL